MGIQARFKRFLQGNLSLRLQLLAPALAVAVIGLFFMGCQKESFHSAPPDASTTTNQRLNPIHSMKFANVKIAGLTCLVPGDCPEAIGELIHVTSRGLDACTVSLVAPTIVLTASHCVPWENVAADRSIAKNCWIRWPALPGKPEQVIDCTAVIKASEFTPNPLGRVRVDYAYLRLAIPSNRVPLAVRPDIVRKANETATAGVSNVIVYGISPRFNPHQIMRLNCDRDDLVQLKTRTVSQEGAMIFPSCPVEHGFSGGPILDPVTLQIIGVTSFIEVVPNMTVPGHRRTIAVGTRHQPL